MNGTTPFTFIYFSIIIKIIPVIWGLLSMVIESFTIGFLYCVGYYCGIHVVCLLDKDSNLWGWGYNGKFHKLMLFLHHYWAIFFLFFFLIFKSFVWKYIQLCKVPRENLKLYSWIEHFYNLHWSVLFWGKSVTNYAV